MQAVGYFKNLPLSAPESLLDLQLPEPLPGPQDLLIEVHAIAVNPVDVKVRASRASSDGLTPVIPGWDGVGIVRGLGAAVQGFAPGDRVWWAGEINRPGSYAQRQCVDHRIAALAPRTLDDAEAAALPLTGITAWELLFERLQVQQRPERPASLLITAAAGGVGSIAVQLARRLPHLRLVASASRPASAAWLRDLGVQHVLDHSQPLPAQWAALAAQGLPPLRYAASLSHTPQHLPALVEMLAPQGRIAAIDDFAPDAVDLMSLKSKSLSFHWEMMFTRSLHATEDMAEQGRILAELARLADAGELRSTLAERLGTIKAATLKLAHARMEAGHQQGKLVLTGFD